MARAKGDALVGNVADEEQVDDAQRVVTERDQYDRANVRKMLATPEGRALYRWFIRLAETGNENPFAGEATHMTAYNCGMLSVAQHARELAKRHAPELYMVMRNESHQQEKR